MIITMEIPEEIKKYIGNEKQISSFKLKTKLLKLKIKEYKCEKCGIDSWNGVRVPLDLHHKNGNSNDNNLSNLEILCPNCHSQTENFRGKNINVINRKRISDLEYKKAIEENINIRRACISLGISPKGGNYKTIQRAMIRLNINFRQATTKERLANTDMNEKNRPNNSEPTKKRRNKYANREEAIVAIRKVKDRPTKQELLKLVWDIPITKLAETYGITDNAIRKWAKTYDMPVPPVGYWRKFQLGKKEECKKIKTELFEKFGL